MAVQLVGRPSSERYVVREEGGPRLRGGPWRAARRFEWCDPVRGHPDDGPNRDAVLYKLVDLTPPVVAREVIRPEYEVIRPVVVEREIVHPPVIEREVVRAVSRPVVWRERPPYVREIIRGSSIYWDYDPPLRHWSAGPSYYYPRYHGYEALPARRVYEGVAAPAEPVTPVKQPRDDPVTPTTYNTQAEASSSAASPGGAPS